MLHRPPKNIADAGVPSLSSIMPKRHGYTRNVVLGGSKHREQTARRWTTRPTNQKIERKTYEHEHYEETGRQSRTGHRRFTQHWRSDRQTTRDGWRGSRPYVQRITRQGQ